MVVTDATNLTNSNFNTPLFLADALVHMADALRTVGFINRQIEVARGEWAKGNKVNLKKAGTFTVQSDAFANMAAIEQATPESSQLSIDQYRTAGMRMNDIEEATVGQNAWDMHTRRIGYAIAKHIETHVNTLFSKVPHFVTRALSAVNETLFIDGNRIFQELGAPEDGADMRRAVIDPLSWAKMMGVAAFTQQQGAGNSGISTQQSAELGQKFGLVPYYSNQLPQIAAPANAPTGGIDTAAAPAGADIIGGGAKGATTVTLFYTGLAAPTIFTAGMIIQLATAGEGLLAPTAGQAYQNQLYAVESSAGVVGGNIVVTLTQPLRQAHAGQWRRIIMAAADAAHRQGGAYYRDAFALCMVQLPGNRPGVRIFTATDQASGLSLRAREVYDGISMINALIFDCWFGAKCIDPDKAIRFAINNAA